MSNDDAQQGTRSALLKGGRPYSHLESIELAERFDEIQAELSQLHELINDPDLNAKAQQQNDSRMALHALTTKNELHDVADKHRKLAAAILLELKIRKVIPLI